MEDTPPMSTPLRIAIDGPAGSGKSTIGERVARLLHYLYVDTGAYYRALTLLAIRQGVNPDDAAALGALAHAIRIRIVSPSVADGRQYTVLVDDEDVTPHLREPAIEATISRIARHPTVRKEMRLRQREMADDHAVVMVGRDIGTVVLPDADLKVYLTTSIDHRARRRHHDLMAQLGANSPSLEEVRADIAARDAKDAEQLRPAVDAHTINNDELEPAETVARVLALYHAYLANRGEQPLARERPPTEREDQLR